MRNRTVETMVGLFMLAGLIAFAILAIKVSAVSAYFTGSQYMITADFDNIGQLKVRAEVSIAGVKVGEVKKINLDSKTFRARVTMNINSSEQNIPNDSAASILTSGLLGANYIALTPGFDDKSLHQGSKIETTHSAIILENLIGQLLFSLKDKEE